VAIEKKTSEINTPRDPQAALWQQIQTTINGATVDAGLEAASQAPAEMREQLYQQVAGKAVATGDVAGARQILIDRISNPFKRQQALASLEQQMIYNAVGRGKFDEALRGIANLRTPRERALLLSQIVNQIGPGQKRATVLNLLELARSMLGPSLQAAGNEQMNALLEIGRAFSLYDSKRGFEIVEPLLDQFNELSTAAVVLNGFGQTYYQGGELVIQNGNSVGTTANQLIIALGNLALVDFDRAKACADRVNLPEVRLAAYLAIAQQSTQGDAGAPSNRRVLRN